MVRDAARLENSDLVAAASLRALSPIGPLDSDWTVLLFLMESIVCEAAVVGLDMSVLFAGPNVIDCSVCVSIYQLQRSLLTTEDHAEQKGVYVSLYDVVDTFASCSSPILASKQAALQQRYDQHTSLLTTVSFALLMLPLPLELPYGVRFGYCCWAGLVSAMVEAARKGVARKSIWGSQHEMC